MDTPLLATDALSYRFPDGRWGIRDVTFSVRPGELLVIAGPNGSGKTLLARHLNGLLVPSEGTVTYRGEDIRKDLPLVRSRVGLVFQDADSQLLGQTVEEDVLFGPRNLHLPDEERRRRMEAALLATGITHLRTARARSLSGGEKRLLAIAGVLAMEPELILLDEPFANLDLPSVRRVLELIVRLQSGGRAILVITHELEKVLASASRLIIMKAGRLVEDGEPPALAGRLPAYDLVSPALLRCSLESMTWLR